ncbi:hypothetical protein AcV7_000603 [Taiwanofungus camphoratus]|nr:hypothetical protein AcV7_000603 [Antrodia cinnamomea]
MMAAMQAIELDDMEVIQLPPELQNLSMVVENNPESFATGNDEIQVAALNATKYVYDLALKSEAKSRAHIAELLSSISPALAPQTRSQTSAASKQRQSPGAPHIPDEPNFQQTPLTELFIDGMNEDQLWAQLELRAKNVCDILEHALDGAGEELHSDGEDDEEGSKKKGRYSLDNDVDMGELDGMEVDSDEYDEDGDSEDGDEDDDHDDDVGRDADLGEGIAELRDPSDEDEGDEDENLDLDKPPLLSGGQRNTKWKPRSGGHPELDDGFFDLAAFNAETEEAEARVVSEGKLGGGGDDEDEDGEDEPIDLFALVDDNSTTVDEEDIEGGSGEPYYKDFFDPPPRPSVPKSKKILRPSAGGPTPGGKVRFHEEVRVKKIAAKGKNHPLSMMFEEADDGDDEHGRGEIMSDDESGDGEGSEDSEDDEEESEHDGFRDSDEGLDAEGFGENEEDSRETIERLKDDLFADEEVVQTGLSTYEKRMAALREEIASLEAENVAKRDWTLMGEATSRSRPQNSLLEEDLEFERIMKSIPVVTEEAVQNLEERIKARILEAQFDDVVRKRPLDDKPFLPSRFFELQDTKSKQSLAEIYEDEYTAAQTGAAGEDRDGKLKKERDELEKIWENIAGKLDALCNAHFTPKTPKATISTVSNVAAAALESALPITMSTSTMLAPEEVYAPTSSDLRARSELAPAEKRALRNKQKKAKKNARDALKRSVEKFAQPKNIGGVKKQKEAALKSVIRTGKGITVVGKKSKDMANKRSQAKS